MGNYGKNFFYYYFKLYDKIKTLKKEMRKMKTERFKNLKISSLNIFKYQGGTSTIYEDGNTLIKVLDGFTDKEQKILYKKAKAMDGKTIKNVLLPDTYYIENEMVKAYSIENLKCYRSFSDYYAPKRFIDCNHLFATTKKASFILKDIHQEKMLINDVSFQNILLNKKGDVQYIDFFEGCSFERYRGGLYSSILIDYLSYHKEKQQLTESTNQDRLSFLLAFWELIYTQNIETISKRKYEKVSNHVTTLQTLKEYRNILLDRSCTIPEIPYMHELIEGSDNYIIDRVTLMSPLEKILYKVKK